MWSKCFYSPPCRIRFRIYRQQEDVLLRNEKLIVVLHVHSPVPVHVAELFKDYANSKDILTFVIDERAWRVV